MGVRSRESNYELKIEKRFYHRAHRDFLGRKIRREHREVKEWNADDAGRADYH